MTGSWRRGSGGRGGLVMWDVEVHGYLVAFVKSMIVLSEICPNMSFFGSRGVFFSVKIGCQSGGYSSR